MRNLIGDEAVDTLLKPFFGGIYAADADFASFADCAPALYDAVLKCDSLSKVPATMKAQRKNSIALKLPKSLTSFPNGLSELPTAVHKSLHQLGAEIRLGVEAVVEKSNPETPHRFKVSWQENTPCFAYTDQLILATPAAASGRILQHIAPEPARRLSTFQSVPLNVVHVGIKSRYIKEKRQGFGFLTRRNENVRMLGSIWSSRIFSGRAPESKTLLTCFYGGQLDAAGNSLSDQALKKMLFADLQRTMGLDSSVNPKKAFELFQVTRWRPALAAYPLGHSDQVHAVMRSLPAGIQLVAGYLGKPALPDRIKAGWAAADQILEAEKTNSSFTAKS